jgi:hypothetical protein
MNFSTKSLAKRDVETLLVLAKLNTKSPLAGPMGYFLLYLGLTNHIYVSFGGSRADAKHVAIANLTGTNSIMTNDKGMLRYPLQNIYGASKGLTDNCVKGQLPLSYVDLTPVTKIININKESV